MQRNDAAGPENLNRWAEPSARLALLVGMLASTAWIVWRIGWSLEGVPLWLSLPALLVEIGGVAGAGLLAWALWPRRSGHDLDDDLDRVRASEIGLVDLVVRVTGQSDSAVRATLVAAVDLRGIGATVVIDRGERPEVAAIAAEFGAAYAAPDADDLNGLALACETVTTPCFLLLDAGDIPAPDIVRLLRGPMADDRVAVVQGRAIAAPGDSPEHGPTGVHELSFERESLNPALGRRGTAMWLGSGSLVRGDAVASLTLGSEPTVEVHLLASAALLRRGWRIVAPHGPPLVAIRSLETSDQVYDDRVRRARAARHLLFGLGGALRPGAPAFGRRAAELAWAVRPLSGLRRGLFLAVLLACIQAGQLPFHPATWAIVGLWAPGFVITALGLALASGWVLRPGDRTRWSMHTLGASYRSLIDRSPSPSARPVVIASADDRHRSAVVGAVIVVSVVMALRGVSEQFTHSLRELPHGALAGLTAVGLWILAMSLDSLRMLARRDRLRRAPRLASALPGELSGNAVSIADITAFGAGVIAPRHTDDELGLHIGQRLTLVTSLSTTSGVTDVELAATVRNLRLATDGGWRVGLEFADPTPAEADALAELCSVEPALRALAGLPHVTDGRPAVLADLPGGHDDGRRVLLRLTALLAVAGAVASAAPGTVSAGGPPQRVLTGDVTVEVGPPPDPNRPGPDTDTVVVDTVVVGTVADTVVDPPADATDDATGDATGGATGDANDSNSAGPIVTVVAVCSLDPGGDDSYGTADDTYGQPVSTTSGADGSFELILDGEACWASVAPPDGFVVDEMLGTQDQSSAIDATPIVGSLIERVPVVTIDVALPSPTLVAVVRTDPLAPARPPSDDTDALMAAFVVDRTGRWTPPQAAPAGAPVAPPATASAPARVLPLPSPASTSPRQQRGESPIVVVTLLLAAGLAVSIALGMARPRRRVDQSSPASSSPDLATRYPMARSARG